MRCPNCNGEFKNDSSYIEHLIKEHQERVRSYLINTSETITYPGGCNTVFEAKDLNPLTVCTKDNFKIRGNRFRWAATFLLAKDEGKRRS